MNTPLAFSFHLPTRVVFRRGAVAMVPALDEVKGKRCMLLTLRSHAPEEAITELAAAASHLTLIRGVEENPRHSYVCALAEQARAERIETVVAIGGGSAMDAAKAVAWFAANPGWRIGEERQPAIPAMKLVAVPTTSGTGSEVSPFSVLTDDETHQKRFLKHPALMPAVALCDPLLTVTMPVQVTADTGIDALSHAVEAYLSVLCQGFMEGIALESCRLVAENLPVVLENDPGDMTARENLMLAALDGGIVLANCGTVFVHALGYCLTAKFGYTHGKANAILLAGFVEHLAERGSPRAQAILDIFGGSLRAFIERCGVPQKLPPGSVTSDEFAAWVSTGYNAYGRVNGVIALDRSDVENVLNRVIA